jgi:hypothetical protein
VLTNKRRPRRRGNMRTKGFLAAALLAACAPVQGGDNAPEGVDAGAEEKRVPTQTDMYAECGWRCDRQYWNQRCPALDSYEELDLCWSDCREDAYTTTPSGYVQAKNNLLVCERLRDQPYDCDAAGYPRYRYADDRCDWERWALEDYAYPDEYVNYKTRALTSCESVCVQSFSLGCERTGNVAYEESCFQYCEDYVHYSVPYTCLDELDAFQRCETADSWGNGRRYICAGGWPYLTYDACSYSRRRYIDCYNGAR